MNPMAPQKLRAAIKELEQTAVAVSVMGTSPRKLKEMAGLAEPVLDAMVGERHEVAAVRSELKKAVQAVRMSSLKAAQASTKMNALAGVMKRVLALVGKGLADVKGEEVAGSFAMVNTWGYPDRDVSSMKTLLVNAERKLNASGFGDVANGIMYLDPRVAEGAVSYSKQGDFLAADLDMRADVRAIVHALGARWWYREMGRSTYEVWGDAVERFQDAVADFVVGRPTSTDTEARVKYSRDAD